MSTEDTVEICIKKNGKTVIDGVFIHRDSSLVSKVEKFLNKQINWSDLRKAVKEYGRKQREDDSSG